MTKSLFTLTFSLLFCSLLFAQKDVDGATDHPAITRYPGSAITWYKVENFMPYSIAIGPITGYRYIENRLETEGRVTRIFYEFDGPRTHSEIYKNYLDAFQNEGFELLAKGLYPERNVKNGPGGGSWIGVAYAPQPYPQSPASKMFRGTSSAGGTAALVAKKERAEGNLYVMVFIRQFSSEKVIIGVDVLEEKAAESGLVVADAEAMGEDIDEYGKVAIYGLYFDHDKASLKPESKPALDEIAKLLKARSALNVYVVGHTDNTGSLGYNIDLSERRARSVVEALVNDYGIARSRLEAKGVGPLVPVFTNKKDAGKAKNRRVELVEK